MESSDYLPPQMMSLFKTKTALDQLQCLHLPTAFWLAFLYLQYQQLCLRCLIWVTGRKANKKQANLPISNTPRLAGLDWREVVFSGDR